MSADPETLIHLLGMAKEASANAYAPYSRFPVGAALLTADGKIITGVNVENASYGLSLCAERVAVCNARTAGLREGVAIAVWAEQRPNGSITPCGACRQVLREFLLPDGLVIYANAMTGKPEVVTMAALLPMAFDLER